MAAAFAFAYKVSGEEWKEKYWAENRLHLDTTIQLAKSQEELDKANSRIQQLEESLRNKEQKPEEVGTFVQHRALRPATPETYRVVFDLDLNGQRILEHLTQNIAGMPSQIQTVKPITSLVNKALWLESSMKSTKQMTQITVR